MCIYIYIYKYFIIYISSISSIMAQFQISSCSSSSQETPCDSAVLGQVPQAFSGNETRQSHPNSSQVLQSCCRCHSSAPSPHRPPRLLLLVLGWCCWYISVSGLAPTSNQKQGIKFDGKFTFATTDCQQERQRNKLRHPTKPLVASLIP